MNTRYTQRLQPDTTARRRTGPARVSPASRLQGAGGAAARTSCGGQDQRALDARKHCCEKVSITAEPRRKETVSALEKPVRKDGAGCGRLRSDVDGRAGGRSAAAGGRVGGVGARELESLSLPRPDPGRLVPLAHVRCRSRFLDTDVLLLNHEGFCFKERIPAVCRVERESKADQTLGAC